MQFTPLMLNATCFIAKFKKVFYGRYLFEFRMQYFMKIWYNSTFKDRILKIEISIYYCCNLFMYEIWKNVK